MKVIEGRLCFFRLMLVSACALSLAPLAEAQHYTQVNLVSDQPGATTLAPNLVNPWGLSRSSTSPWWVANNGTGTATIYNAAGTPAALVVTIPAAHGSGTGVPTGTVFNGTTDFQVTPGNPARFLFVTEDGTVSGWNPTADATHAIVKFTDDDAVYKSLAVGSHEGHNFLYAANFSERRIDVFAANFERVRPGRSHFAEFAFKDPLLPHGYAPFNVQNVGGVLYVTYAKTQQGSDDEVHGAGFGFVDAFSTGGHLVRRLEHGPWLNAPWGVALAPGDFGKFSHRLLVGQFGSGEIAVYNVTTGQFVDKVRNVSDQVLSIEGLWALSFGNGGNAGPLNTLYFTAGIADESHGLFGSLTAVASEQTVGNGE
jgi:uncharacterized protein (TIGR03118 family)